MITVLEIWEARPDTWEGWVFMVGCCWLITLVLRDVGTVGYFYYRLWRDR